MATAVRALLLLPSAAALVFCRAPSSLWQGPLGVPAGGRTLRSILPPVSLGSVVGSRIGG
eukprot:2333780-Prymnesium_polylepis.1